MELALIFVLELAGLVLGVALARAAFGAEPGVGVRRVVAAIERASRAFLARTRVRLAALVVAVVSAILALGFAGGHANAGTAAAVGVVLGVALSFASAVTATVLGSRAAAAVVRGASTRFDLALGAAVRGAGATGVIAQALGVLGTLGLLGAGQWFHRAQTGIQAGDLAHLSVLALPGYALGAALVAQVLDGTAGSYATAARGGEAWAVLRDASILRHETKNPALVASLVGERLEHGAAAARLFAASACATGGAVTLAFGPAGTTATELRWAAFPLLLWGFGLVANGAGLFVVRTLEAQGSAPGLFRGQLSATIVWLAGLLGGAYWLFPEAWLPLSGAGAVGLIGGALAPYGAAAAFARRHGALREALDGLRAGPANAQTAALGFGLGHVAFTLVILGASGALAEHLGVVSQVPGGERLALMLALFAAMSFSPFAMAVEAGATIADTARGVAAMGGADAEAHSRVQRVADSGLAPAAIARSHLTLTQVLGALAATVGLSATGGGAPGTSGSVAPWVGLLGAALVLRVAGSAARRSARGARELALEIERQLGSTVPEAPGEGRAPSYRACEEAAGRVGLSGGLGRVAVALGGPVLLGIALRLVYRESGPRLAAEALATLVAGAAVTALGVALAVDGARAVLAGARRASRPEGDPATHAASVTGSALAEILGSAAGPAACTAALITASLAFLARTLIP